MASVQTNAKAQSLNAQTFELANMTQLQVDVKKGVDPAKVEAAIADEWQKFLKDGPTADELQRAKTIYQADTIRGLEQVGCFSGKAVTLAEGQVYRGDPGAWKEDYDATMAATPAAVKAAADKLQMPLSLPSRESSLIDREIVSARAQFLEWPISQLLGKGRRLQRVYAELVDLCDSAVVL